MDVSNNNKPSIQDEDGFIEDETHCVLCGTELTFKHEVDYAQLSVREDAHCPACRIQLRAKEHVLH